MPPGAKRLIVKINSFERVEDNRPAYRSMAEQCRQDLFSGPADFPTSRKDCIMVRLEAASSSQVRVVARVAQSLDLLALSGLIALFVLGETLAESDPLFVFRSNAYEITNICIGCCCLLMLSVQLTTVARHCWLARHMHWTPRRLRMFLLTFATCLVEALNLVFYIAANSHIVAVRCSWTSVTINVFGILQWSCWNTILCLCIMSAHSLNQWSPNNDGKVSITAQEPLVMDAPWQSYARHVPMWIIYELAIIIPWIVQWKTGDHSTRAVDRTGPDCRYWVYRCIPSVLVRISMLVWAALFCVYTLMFSFYTIKTRVQLRSRPHAQNRVPNILLQVQIHSTVLFFKITLLSAVLLTLAKPHNCWSYVESWLGYIPMHISGVCLAVVNLWLLTPTLPRGDACAELYLADPVWAEADKEDKVAARMAATHEEAARQMVSQLPMFCVETAFKLHRWSQLAYQSVGEPGDADAHANSAVALAMKEDELIQESFEASEAVNGGEGSSESKSDALLQDMEAGLEDRSQPVEASPRAGEAPRSVPDEASPSPPLQGSRSIGNDTGSSSMEERKDLEQLKQWAPEEMLSNAMSLYSLTDMQTFWDPGSDTKAVLGWNRSLMVLAFRGTASLRNALSDIKVWHMDHPVVNELTHLGLRPTVHSGFYRAWTEKGFNKQVISHIQRLLASGEVDGDARVYVTGHSLGGALAMLAAYDLRRELRLPHMQVVTFGAPYIGNAAFSKSYESHLPDTWNIITEKDPVTRTGKFFLSKRPGHRVIINAAGEMIVHPNPLEIRLQGGRKMRHHWLASYRLALLNVCRLQFSVRGTAAGRAGVLRMGRDPALHADLAHDGFEWTDMRKAARWGEQVLQRMRPPKPDTHEHKTWWRILNPLDFLMLWGINRSHKRRQTTAAQQRRLSRERLRRIARSSLDHGVDNGEVSALGANASGSGGMPGEADRGLA